MQTKRESRCREQVGTPASRPVPPAKTARDLYGVVGHANMSDSPVVGGFDRALTHTISGGPLAAGIVLFTTDNKVTQVGNKSG
jgi:hypothetical protein